jgi:hypothetical protein
VGETDLKPRHCLAIFLALLSTIGCSSSPGKAEGGIAGHGDASGSGGGGPSGTQASGGHDASDMSEAGDGSGGSAAPTGDAAAETNAGLDAGDAGPAEAGASLDAKTDLATFSCPAPDQDANVGDAAVDVVTGSSTVVPGCPFPQDPFFVSGGASATVGLSIVVNDDGGFHHTEDATYRWESRNARCGGSGGTFDAPTASGTHFTCSLPGRTTLILHIERPGTTCDYVWSADIECELGQDPAAIISVGSAPNAGPISVDVFTDGSAMRWVWPPRAGVAPSPPPLTFAAGSPEGTRLLADLALVGDVSMLTLPNCPETPQTSWISIEAGGNTSGDLHCLRAPTGAQSALVQDCFALTGTQ